MTAINTSEGKPPATRPCRPGPMSTTPAAGDADDAQARLVAALRHRVPFEGRAERTEVLETHISRVLLTGEFAYKIKKPVDLGFVDFTSLDARRRYCEDELRLNRRLAPALYLGVVAITGTPASPGIDGSGPILEYAVKMREFPQDALASRELDRGRLTPLHIDELAATVAAFHARADVAGADSPFAAPDDILRAALDNFTQIGPLPGDPIAPAALDALRAWTGHEHATLASHFEQRRRGGFVRECHGDLHLGNIAIVDGRVTIFDCIEFSERLRWIDVLSEVAFTVMDLLHRKRPDLAYRFLNAWLEITGDYAGLAALRFHLVYRAMVRAKVTLLRATQLGHFRLTTVAPVEFRDYLDLATRCARTRRPAIVVTHGVSGSGKTALSQRLLQETGAIRIRTDIERKRMHGLAASEPSGSPIAGGLYTEEAKEATYRRVLALARGVAAAGQVAIIDGTFLERRHRDMFRNLAAEIGATFLIMAVDATEAELRQRVALRHERAADASEADPAVVERQLRMREPLAPDERSAAVALDANVPLERMRDTLEWRDLLERIGGAGPG